MAESTETRRREWLVWTLCAGIPLLLSGGAAGLCHWAAGNSLGLYLGMLAVALALSAALTVAEAGWRRQLVALGGGVLGIAIVLLIAGGITVMEWAKVVLVLGAFALSMGGMAAGLARWRIHPAIAAAAPTLLGALWLTWPVWAAPQLVGEARQTLVARLVSPHPLFAINGALLRAHPEPWAQYRLAYKWTNIGDDIPYHLPHSVLPCVALHGLIAAAGFGVAGWRRHSDAANGTPGN